MNHALESIFNNIARTQNGAVTNASTGNACLDLFSIVAASRQNPEQLIPLFDLAMEEDLEIALRIMLWARDCRGGAGERKVFRTLVRHVQEYDFIDQIIAKIPELGRWDDLLIFDAPVAKELATQAILTALRNGNGLAAKWLPRQDRDGARHLRETAGMTPKQWRKYLVGLSNTVEQQMSARNWNEINFEHVPSLAASRLQKAFARNCRHFQDYLTKLTTGEAKVNASVIVPHEIIAKVGSPLAEAQWAAQPNWIGDSQEKFLPVVDVSGSMDSHGVMQHAVGLGIYLAERNNSAFKDYIISFSGRPNLHKVTGKSLAEKVNQVRRSGEDMSTNLVGVFDALLNGAKRNGVAAESMPTTLVVLSDMEFNQADYRFETNYDSIVRRYKEAGYEMPKLIFWNLHGRPKNSPVVKSNVNTALVSGFSPAIMKTVLSGVETTPLSIMLETVLNDRYAITLE